MATTRKGRKLTKTGRYEITATAGRKRRFFGTLLTAFNLGKVRVALFSIPKRKKKQS